MRRHRITPSLVISLIALSVALSGTALAANGDGLLLGGPNTATAKTTLTANFNGAALQLTNTKPYVAATALNLHVAANRPPLITNSSGLVANLNADQLDGIDSSGFLQASGTGFGNSLVVPFGSEASLGSVSGLFDLEAQCTNDASGQFGQIIVTNDDDTSLDLFSIAASGSHAGGGYGSLPSGGTGVLVSGAQGGGMTTTLLGGAGVPHEVMISAGAAYRFATDDCAFQVQAVDTRP